MVLSTALMDDPETGVFMRLGPIVLLAVAVVVVLIAAFAFYRGHHIIGALFLLAGVAAAIAQHFLVQFEGQSLI